MKLKISSLGLGFILGLSAMTVSASGLQTVTPNYVSSDYAKTKYPIVFNHGMFGFTRLGTSSFGLDYFYQVLPDLARNGAKVYATQVSPLETTEVRGEQLLQQVDEVLALTGSAKVNLIGHSHGGPTIRYIEIVAPNKVASLTAVAGTIKGSKVADDLLNNQGANALLTVVSQYIVAPVITLLENNPSLPNSLNHSLQSISEKGSAEFNAKFPSAAIPQDCGNGQKVTANGVYHYSWTGKAQLTNVLDLTDAAISTLAPLSYKNLDNDGLVSRCNTHFGQVIRDNYDQTHLDEVNQILGLRGLFSPNPVDQFRQQANRLKLEGL
ncbi:MULTISPECIES: triacylglycerol lipase [unclassified Acinetobacter]|jgi:triacylglycerol lipase|uniref:esterase/lipase family protein n=1 Tax=Acinetobacter TaxID=469 RepID=UPI0018AA4B52|nr:MULTISPECIES: triacylglycerol lipase [unclassified Acinetobacter]MBJ9953945.1 triacylglycerol lipase [Acinetobacter baumannii]